MNKILFCILVGLACSFEIIEEFGHPPETYFGDASIACNPGAGGTTGGFGTDFNDNQYDCDHWNGKAKGLPDCFVAINGRCGMDKSKFCDKCISVMNSNGGVEKCRVIDFCDPANCGYYDAGHLDFLNNNGDANYKFIDKGVYVFPYSKDDGQPKITWRWTSC